MYREPVPPSFEPFVSFNKGPVDAIRRQVRLFLFPTIFLGLVGVGAAIFSICAFGFSTFNLVMAFPLILPIFMGSIVRTKLRGIKELEVEITFSPQVRVLRFTSPDHAAVELPLADVRALAYREKELDSVQTVRGRFVRASFAIVAETRNGDVEVTQPLVCTGTGFIAAGRAHLQKILPGVDAKIAAVPAVSS